MEECSLIMLKPDVYNKKLIGKIIREIEKIDCEIKFIITNKQLTKKHAELFYKEHKDREFFNKLINHITSGMVTFIVVKGNYIIGKLDTFKKYIRFKYDVSDKTITENLIHTSDSKEDYEHEFDIMIKIIMEQLI